MFSFPVLECFPADGWFSLLEDLFLLFFNDFLSDFSFEF